MKNSVRYAKPTIKPVTRMILFMSSRWCIVIRCSSAKALRRIMSSVITIAKPEKIAPATKYGGKIVVCQPGTIDVAKS